MEWWKILYKIFHPFSMRHIWMKNLPKGTFIAYSLCLPSRYSMKNSRNWLITWLISVIKCGAYFSNLCPFTRPFPFKANISPLLCLPHMSAPLIFTKNTYSCHINSLVKNSKEYQGTLLIISSSDKWNHQLSFGHSNIECFSWKSWIFLEGPGPSDLSVIYRICNRPHNPSRSKFG